MKKPDHLAPYFADPDVHDVTYAGNAGGVSLVTAILLSIGHAVNVWLFFFAGAIDFTGALLFHAILSFASLLIARAFGNRTADSRFLWMLFITSSTLSVFGATGMVITLLMHHWYLRFSQPFAQWFASIFPHAPLDESQRIYDDIVIGRDEASKNYSVIPFVDVLWYGNEAQKRTALSKMTSRFHPSFAPAFKKALNDSSNTIRVQAATAISKIENQFVARLMKLARLHDEKPTDPIVILALAEHYDDYAFTGILDIDRERHNREEALKHYTLYLERKPNDTDVRQRVGRLLLRSGEYVRAADWLKDSIDAGHQTPTMLTWYVEALYASGRYAELRLLATSTDWKGIGSLQPRLPAALGLWAGNEALAKGAAA